MMLLGTAGIFCFLYKLMHKKSVETKNLAPSRTRRTKLFLALIVSIFIMLSGLFWLINFNPFENDYPTFRLAVLNEGFTNLQRIDIDFSSVPIVLAESEDGSLLVFTYTTTKTPFGLDKYFIKARIWLLSSPLAQDSLRLPVPWIPAPDNSGEFNESRVCSSEYFPGVWFGIVYSDKRNLIRINGKVPSFHDVHFNGSDYSFWYIENDAYDPLLTFE